MLYKKIEAEKALKASMVQVYTLTSDYEIHYTKDFRKKIKVSETE